MLAVIAESAVQQFSQAERTQLRSGHGLLERAAQRPGGHALRRPLPGPSYYEVTPRAEYGGTGFESAWEAPAVSQFAWRDRQGTTFSRAGQACFTRASASEVSLAPFGTRPPARDQPQRLKPQLS